MPEGWDSAAITVANFREYLGHKWLEKTSAPTDAISEVSHTTKTHQ